MRVLCLILFISIPALASPLCEPVVSASHPRRVDIRFPDKTVTVVGHLHLHRNDANEEDGLESTLIKMLTGQTPLTTRAEIRQARQRLDQLLRTDAQAVRHWREDLRTLDRAVRENNVSVAYSEQPLEHQARLLPLAPHVLENGPAIFQRLGFSREQAEELIMISLSPALYYEAKYPDRNLTASTSEPSLQEEAEYTQRFCPAKRDFDHEAQIVLDALIAKIKQRGIPESTVINRIQLGLRAFNAEFEKDIDGRLTPEQSLGLFLNSAGMTFTPEERQLMHTYFVVFLEGRPKPLDLEYLVRNLASNIANYNDCWGRDALMARNQASGHGNSILFVGIGHLAPQAALLKRECLSRLGQQPPNPNPLGGLRAVQ